MDTSMQRKLDVLVPTGVILLMIGLMIMAKMGT
jgi:hypothetical protein